MFLTEGTWSALVSFPTLSSSLSSSFSSSLFLNYSSFSSMSFSLIYICCSFRGGILSVVFRTVAICFWPAMNLECPCLFSDLILFPSSSFSSSLFLNYSSFSSMSFSLIYICCSFRGGILSVVFPAVAICFCPAGNLDCPGLFSDLILFPFLLLFFYCSFSFLFFCLFHWSISVVVSGEAFYLLFSPLYPYVSDPQGTWSALVSFPTLSASLSLSFCFYNVPFPSFSSMSGFIDLYLL